MEKFRILALLWMLFLLNVLETVNAEEIGYIFTCPRSLKYGATNQLQLRRFGNLNAGVLNVKVTYSEGWGQNETTAVEASYNIEEGELDHYFDMFIPVFDTYVYSGKIYINGTIGDNYEFGGSEKINFNSAKDYITLIQTDKPLYKEGQTVKFRVLRINKELKPAVQENAEIWVEDPQGTRLFQWKDVSLGKGIKQFEFPLANEPVKGEWKISASFNGDVSTTTFEVKEYVLPKFDVKIEIPPFVLANAEEIPIKICANYTYGKPVKGLLKMNVSLEKYSWSNEKVPTLEHEAEIDGCYEYTINVTMVETEDFYRYRRLQIVASVQERGTDVTKNVTQYIQRQYTPLTLSFNREQKQFYKPGLPYNGKLFVKNPDNTPAVDEDIELSYTVTKERVVMDGKWRATRTVKYSQNFTSDEAGIIEFVIPRQNTDSTQINVEAKSLKYGKEPAKPGAPRQATLSQPSTSMSLTPWFSPSGSFIQLQQVQKTLLCGTMQKIKLLFTSKTDGDYKFYYQILHQGAVVQRGFVEKSFSVSDDVASQYEDEDKVIDDEEVQLVPAFDPSQPQENADEECKSSKEARYVPPVGEVDFEMNIDPSLSPSFQFIAYYIRDDRETVADSQKFTVEKCFKNQVKLQFGDDVKQPGTKTSIRVTSSPNSLCGIKVVDKSLSLLNPDDQLTAEKIFNIIESFDGGIYYSENRCNGQIKQAGLSKSTSDIIIRPPQPWTSSTYEDSLVAFENAGLLVISDFILFTRPCKLKNGNIVYDDYNLGNGAVAMASVARRPAAAPGRPMAADKMGEVATKSVVDVRDYFPETWLFELEMTGDDGVYLTKEKLPHTITEWVGSAVCINDEDGLGLSNTTSIKGFQAFFISTTLPYSVVRGEAFWITISVFSYVDKPLPVKVTLDQPEGFEVTSESIDKEICIPPGDSYILRLQLKGTSLGTVNITVRAESAQSSDICGSSEVSDALAKDAIRNSFIVVAEGWPGENVKSFLFCPKDEENEVFKKTCSLTEPEDVVPDSSRAYVDFSGSVLGKSLNNLDNLVQLPTGCGEQNMVKLAPNVDVLDVLLKTKQLSEKMKNKILKNINTGVQRQLKYKRSDGSFSAFGPRDKEGSMFLTAFVLKYFSRASKYVTIDNSTIIQMQNWITSKQQSDGCFPDVGKIIDRGIQGGLENKSNGTITAYVLSSLLESEYNNQTVKDQALKCVQNSKDTSFYATFLFAYAEILAGKTDEAKERINSVKDRSIKKGGTEHFHDVNTTKSQDVETTAYAVICILKSGGSANDALSMVQYLTQNMNPRGGFICTQDTVVGLSAISLFAAETYKDPLDILIKVTGGLEETIQITDDDKLILKRHKVVSVPSEINVEAQGSGCAFFQCVLRYNTKTPPEKRSFNLDVGGKCSDDKCKKGFISISVSFIPEGKKTGMTVIEIKLISGWTPVKEILDALLNDARLKIMRYDIENDQLVFYFLEMSNEEIVFTFEVEEVFEVENPQPGQATVYNYYDRDISSSTSYTIKNCQDSKSCPKEP